MKIFVQVVLVAFLLSSPAFSQQIPGGLIYQTYKGIQGVPIYGIDPTDPTYAVSGDNLALYARRIRNVSPI